MKSESVTTQNSEQNMAAEALLKAAKTLFATKGFDAVTVREIGELAEVNPALINYHFNGKLELYRTIISNFGTQRLKRTQEIFKSCEDISDFRNRIHTFCEDFIQSYLEDFELHTIVHRDCELGFTMTEDIFKKTFMVNFETTVQFFNQALKKGFLKSGVSADMQTRALFNMLMGFVQKDKMHKRIFGTSLNDKKYRDEVIQTVVGIFCDGTIFTQ